MNEIKLKGIIKNIQQSHTIKDISYDKADLIVKRPNGIEDILSIRFKSLSNFYKDGDLVSLTGHIRSYSHKLESGKNKVDIYTFTYFDKPDEANVVDQEETVYSDNVVNIDGRICKIENVRNLSNGKKNIHFILANNLIVSDSKQKLNSYIPCIAWGKLADKLSKLGVNSKISISGRLQSREYKKVLDDGSYEIRVAHELCVADISDYT